MRFRRVALEENTRRADREVTDYGRMLDILQQCDCCRLGFVDGEGSYIVPMNFGFEDEGGKLSLYFHGALRGKKMELAQSQHTVSFETDRVLAFTGGADACSYTCRFQSVMGRGRIRLLESPGEKAYGLSRIMEHYAGNGEWTFPAAAVSQTAVLRLDVVSWSCKERL